MRRDLERRLRQLETTGDGSATIEFWVDEEDGTVSGPRGERITRDAFHLLQKRGRPPNGAVLVLSYPEDELL
jgi:hypothetical protein